MRLINGIDLAIQLATCKAHLVGESEWIRGYKDGLTTAFDLLAKAPTIEAEPVKHGRWIATANDETVCSNCGIRIPEMYSNADSVLQSECCFCHSCGAKMDLEG